MVWKLFLSVVVTCVLFGCYGLPINAACPIEAPEWRKGSTSSPPMDTCDTEPSQNDCDSGTYVGYNTVTASMHVSGVFTNASDNDATCQPAPSGTSCYRQFCVWTSTYKAARCQKSDGSIEQSYYHHWSSNGTSQLASPICSRDIYCRTNPPSFYYNPTYQSWCSSPSCHAETCSTKNYSCGSYYSSCSNTTYNCGSCDIGSSCINNQCIAPTNAPLPTNTLTPTSSLTPTPTTSRIGCEGKSCGGDGAGGTCGSCGIDEGCLGGVCTTIGSCGAGSQIMAWCTGCTSENPSYYCLDGTTPHSCMFAGWCCCVDSAGGGGSEGDGGSPPQLCGDGTCNTTEDCRSCNQDCGSCGPFVCNKMCFEDSDCGDTGSCTGWGRCRAPGCTNDSTCACAVTATATPPPTPTQQPWVKLKNGSFQSDATLNNVIPNTVQPFDSSDDGSRQFITGNNSGTVVAPNINVGSSNVTQNQWKSNYSPRMSFDKSKALSYIQSRKDHTVVSSVPDQLIKDGIYIYNGNLNLNTAPSANSTVVLVVNGTVTINANLTPPAGKSFTIIADTITVNNTVSSLTGIYVADNFNTGTGGGLKVTGNLVVNNTLDNRRSQPNNNAPALFIIFDPTTYVNLLPYLSISKYEWRQLK